MTASVPCNAGDWTCPYIKFCFARLNDKTVVGCGIPLWWHGFIKWEEIAVAHAVKGGRVCELVGENR